MTRKLRLVFAAAAALAFAATDPASAYERSVSVKRYKLTNAWPKMSKPKEIVVVGTPKKSQRSRPRTKGHVKAFSGQDNQ
jgi:hypothetical protein